jgi:hypothetical protein
VNLLKRKEFPIRTKSDIPMAAAQSIGLINPSAASLAQHVWEISEMFALMDRAQAAGRGPL